MPVQNALYIHLAVKSIDDLEWSQYPVLNYKAEMVLPSLYLALQPKWPPTTRLSQEKNGGQT